MKSLKKLMTDTPQNTKKVPLRRCVGCMESKPKKDLIRIVCADDKPILDPTGKANGRGIYLCKDDKCLQLAKKKKSLQRGLKLPLSSEAIEEFIKEFADYAK